MITRKAFALLLPLVFTAMSLPADEVSQAGSISLKAKGPILRIVVTGDAGATHSHLRAGILAVQQQQPIDAIVLVGDNFYQCGVSSIQDPQWSKITEHFGPAGVPIFPVLGNHDYGDPGPDRAKSALCSLFPTDPMAEIHATGTVPGWFFPSENYVVRTPSADLLMMDTEPVAMNFDRPFLGSGTSTSVTEWLRQRLHQSATPWRIVVGHHTIYSSGVHGRTNGFDQRNMRRLLPLLQKEHVDLYICGHDHDLELLGDLHHRRGPLFLVSGAGSGTDEMRARKPKALISEPPTLFPTPIAAMYGFALLEIESSRLTITFYDQAGALQGHPFVIAK